MLTPDFASVWPSVATRLTGMLRRRGVNPHDADEIVQETAARAFGTAVPYTDADDLFRWASVVGWRLAIDVRRRSVRLSGDEVPERADTIDVAMVAEHRIVLSAVQDRLTELSARDQEVLLSSFDEEPRRTRLESVRVAVARHRARNRLRALLDGLVGGVVALWARRNRLWSAPAEAVAFSAVPVAAYLVIGVVAWTGPEPRQVELTPAPASVSATASPVSGRRVALPTSPGVSDGTTQTVRPARPQSAAAPQAVPPLAVVVARPGGPPASASVRPSEESDHLACVTGPPTVAIPGTCVDLPITTGISPP